MTVRVYRRVSTNLQDLESQNHGIEGYLKNNGITSYVNYEEPGITGTIAERPVYQKLLSEVGSGDIVLVYEYSRMWRDLEEQAKITKKFMTLGVTLISTKEGAVVTIDDVLKLNILGSVNQHEAERFRRRSKEGIRALQEKVANGEAVWNGRGQDKTKRKTDGYFKRWANHRNGLTQNVVHDNISQGD